MNRVGESERAVGLPTMIARKASTTASERSPNRDSGGIRLRRPGRLRQAVAGSVSLVLYSGGLLLTLAAMGLTLAAFAGTWLLIGPRRSDVGRRRMAARPIILTGAATALAALIGVIILNPDTRDPMTRIALVDVDSEIDAVAQVLALTRWEAETTPPPLIAKLVAKTVIVKSGDSLASVLRRAGVNQAQAYAAVRSLRDIYDPRREFKVGDSLKITLSPVRNAGADGSDLAELWLPVAYNRDVVVRPAPGGTFVAKEIEKVLNRSLVRVEGTIKTSLFQDGRAAGIPAPIISELIRIYSFSVDFQRELQKGDRFELVFERFFGPDGEPVHEGKVQFANLALSGTEQPIYLYETSDGNRDYFTDTGETIRRTLMRTPIDGARLTSGFGKRRHPVLGYTKLHSGIDFGAPRGTPILAAGDGRIAQLGRNGAYGKYVRIRHNSAYQTAYAHLNGYAAGLGVGSRVRQGQIIAYVGSTGRATGPHLHYEIIENGRQINPLKLRLPSGEKLKGPELERFLAFRANVDAQYASSHRGKAACEDVDGDGTTTC